MANEQLSIFEQARESQPELDDAELVAQLCEELLDEAEVEPPVPVDLLASLRGIARVKNADQPFAGMLSSDDDGRLVVTIRQGDGPRRRRFTVCHEAAHTLFPGFREGRQYRCNGERTWTELLCDQVAAGLLLPRRFFVPDLAEAGFGLGAVEELGARYQASIEATGRRVVDLWEEASVMIVLEEAHKPSERSLEDEVPKKLRVQYSHSNGQWPFVPRRKSAADDGLGRALGWEVIDEVAEIDELFAGEVGPVRVQARRYGDRVIALVRKREGNEE